MTKGRGKPVNRDALPEPDVPVKWPYSPASPESDMHAT